MILLAEANALVDFVRDASPFVGIIAAIVVIIWTVKAKKKEEREIGPQPFKVQAAEEFVPKRDFEKHVAHNTDRHHQLFEQIKVVREEIHKELKSDTAELHSKINKVDKEVGGISAGMTAQNQQLASINATVTRILERKQNS